MQTLFRMVEISSGSIEVDGVDISKIGLADLRKKIAILPQDAFLFAGTVRTNLDPFGEHEDAELYDALKRAWLVEQDQPAPAESAAGDGDGAATPVTPTNGTRFTLDLAIEDEGGNLSVGERSLVSLARALVKNSKIIVLECVAFACLVRARILTNISRRFCSEATASVDYATDSRIQATIRKEFSDKTLLVIAHRLRTIIDSDRVLVMDAGQVAEYDSVFPTCLANVSLNRRLTCVSISRSATQPVPRKRHLPLDVRPEQHLGARHPVDDLCLDSPVPLCSTSIGS